MKKMKVIISACIFAMLLIGCGEKSNEAVAPVSESEVSSEETITDELVIEETAPQIEDTGKVLNIYCWNSELKNIIQKNYPGYTETDDLHGTIGDVEVVWNITPLDDDEYQTNLDIQLLAQDELADDEKVDIFLIDADCALKYIETDYVLSIEECGLTAEDIAYQYQYAKNLVSDAAGNIKGLAYRVCPGALFYNKNAASEVLGTDDADAVWQAVKDWDTFLDTAAIMKEAGYKMTATSNDTFQVFSNNISSKWVEGGTVNPENGIKAWVDVTKQMIDANYTTTADLWSDDWKEGLYPQGKVFCYFGPSWLINNCMDAHIEGSIAGSGDWGVVAGPQSFFWGGEWICVSSGSDNKKLAGEIMKLLTCDFETMKTIAMEEGEFVNNSQVMDTLALDSSYSLNALGGINPVSVFCNSMEGIDVSNRSLYDSGCNESFRLAMRDYFKDKITYEEAIELFNESVVLRYPELTF